MSGLPMIPVESLHRHPGNVRRVLGDVTELAASIRAQGLLQPLVVMKDATGWTVIDGHRRLAAAICAGARALPCIATKPGDAGAQLSMMLAAAMHKGLDPIDQAHAFFRLRARALSVADIARMTGYSTATVSARLLLVDLPYEVQDLVAAQTITVAEATVMAREVRAARTGTAFRKDIRSRWLDRTHRLAAAASASCGHRATRVLVGAVACGQCWEHAIRVDEHTTEGIAS